MPLDLQVLSAPQSFLVWLQRQVSVLRFPPVPRRQKLLPPLLAPVQSLVRVTRHSLELLRQQPGQRPRQQGPARSQRTVICLVRVTVQAKALPRSQASGRLSQSGRVSRWVPRRHQSMPWLLQQVQLLATAWRLQRQMARRLGLVPLRLWDHRRLAQMRQAAVPALVSVQQSLWSLQF